MHTEMRLRLLIPGLALASLVTLSACAGGGNDNSSPAQTNNQPAQAPAPAPAPAPPVQAPAPAPTPTPTPTPPPPAADPLGHAMLTDLKLTGISATFTAPQPAAGGQQEVIAVDDNAGGHDEHAALNVPWRDAQFTAHLAQTGTATYQVDATSLQTSILFTGAGIINTEGGRFGNILAGESGDLTVTAKYTLTATPGVASTGRVDLTLWNITTDELKGISAELPEDNTGILSLTIHFNAGDIGSLNYGVSLRSEGKIVP